MEERFDLIVVGAGPAGTAAALTAAKAGLKVIMFERGEQPGSKNMMGGVLYTHELAEMVPEFWKDAPVERALIEEKYWMLSDDSAITFSFRNKGFGEAPYNGFSVLRARFDNWFADKAVEAGVLLVTETLVEKLIMKDGVCVGVETGRLHGDVYADAVIVAEGVNALLTRDLGIRDEWQRNEVGVGVKELINLPRATIDERFNLVGDEGVSMRILGGLHGMTGGVFLYTNKASVSFGFACMVEDIAINDFCPHELMEELKEHPIIKPLVAGGNTIEYSAHMVPEMGYKAVPKQLAHNGLLITGDAAAFSNLVTGEGSNLAMNSGKQAAEAVVKAKEHGDFSRNGLKSYEDKMNASYVMKDLEQFKDFTGWLHSERDILGLYPELLNSVAKEVLTADGVSRGVKINKAKEMIKAKKSYRRLFLDAYRAWRALT